MTIIHDESGDNVRNDDKSEKRPTKSKLGDGGLAWLSKNLKTRLTFVMAQFLEILVHLKKHQNLLNFAFEKGES